MGPHSVAPSMSSVPENHSSHSSLTDLSGGTLHKPQSAFRTPTPMSLQDARSPTSSNLSGSSQGRMWGAATPPPKSWYSHNMSGEDEHVTVWQPATGKTVAGNAAPYRRNLQAWLQHHPGWEEKADELKSSKRRSAARRTKNANSNFAELCLYSPLASVILTDLYQHIHELSDGEKTPPDDDPLSGDAILRMQEAFVEMGRRIFMSNGSIRALGDDRWRRFAFAIDSKKDERRILIHAHDMMLQRRMVLAEQQDLEYVGSPVSPYHNPSQVSMSLPTTGAPPRPSFLERPFRTPREPRVTVWHPATGRTVSGNAAPCRRNLDTWIAAHPGWEPKSEDKLSSSRRKKAKLRARSPRTNVPSSPTFSASAEEALAADGLILLGSTPCDTVVVSKTPAENSDNDIEMSCSSRGNEEDDEDDYMEDVSEGELGCHTRSMM